MILSCSPIAGYLARRHCRRNVKVLRFPELSRPARPRRLLSPPLRTQKSVCQVDVRNADAFNADDKKMIMLAVERTVGFSEARALTLCPPLVRL